MTRIKFNKSQSALEFLTTYGWAFLVILLMIAALGYFGVMNPTKFLPERCMVDSEFSCEEYSLKYVKNAGPTHQIYSIIVLKNTFDKGIELNSINGQFGFTFLNNNLNLVNVYDPAFPPNLFPNILRNSDNFDFLSSTNYGMDKWCIVGSESANIDGTKLTVLPGESFAIKCGFIDNSFESLKGTKQKVEFTITYVPEGKSIPKQIVGEMFTTVQ